MEGQRTENLKLDETGIGEGILTVHPQELGIGSGRGHCDSESITKGGLEQKDGHDKGFHTRGRFSEGVFESGNTSKDLGESDEEIGRSLDGDVNAVGRGFIGCRASQRSFVAWPGGVDQMLRDRRISHCNCS